MESAGLLTVPVVLLKNPPHATNTNTDTQKEKRIEKREKREKTVKLKLI